MSITTMNAGVPDAIRGIMTLRGLKHKAVAARAGIDPHDFSDMLSGRKLIKISNLIDIANALDVTPNDLFKQG